MHKRVKYSLIGNLYLKNIISTFNKLFGLPQINKQLSIFSKSTDKELIIRLINKEGYFKIRSIGGKDSEFTKFHTKNIKTFLEYFVKCGFLYCKVKDITEIHYKLPKGKIVIALDTNIGNVLKIIDSDTNTLNRIKSKCNNTISFFGKSKLDVITNANNFEDGIESEEIINKFGVIHPIIVKYIHDTGLHISNNIHNLRNKIESFGNDYSFYENAFFQITGKNLLGEEEFNYNYNNTGISIIIPSYNSKRTIKSTLISINNQNISSSDYKNIQVIVVDDASDYAVKNVIGGHEFKFQLSIIRSETNQGRAITRNIGLSLAKFNNIICIDADIILPNNYLKEMLYRIEMIPNAIFMSFRKNINNGEITTEHIKGGLEKPASYDDNRLERFIKKGQYSYHKIQESGIIQLLSESNYLKNLGYGRCIGLYDLPLTVSSHNICFNKKYVNHKFNENFSGRGMEDSFFGAEAISKGIFIIPVLSTGVYHVKHATKPSNEQIKKQELKRNIIIYKQLLEENDD